MAAHVQSVASYAGKVLESLNVQRERAQFCDCVLVQRLNPGQVYPAHRCVLSASSPVLASILSSSGALVELRDPCLSDQVLAMLLDYIYTGSIECTHSQDKYYHLLNAATYLQMEELQETLRAWLQTEAEAADEISGGEHSQLCKDMKSIDGSNVNRYRISHMLSRTCTVKSSDGTCDTQMDTCRDSLPCKSCHENDTNRGDDSPSRHASTSYYASENISRSNTGRGTKDTDLISQNLTKNFPDSIDMSHKPGPGKPETERRMVRRAVYRGHFSSTCTAELQVEENSKEGITTQRCLAVHSDAEGGTMNNEEGKNNTQIRHSPPPCPSTSTLKDNISSSSSRPICGAVSVICHSSTASIPQVAEEPTMPLYPPVRGEPCSQSGSMDNKSIVESIIINHEDLNRAQNQNICRNGFNTDDRIRQIGARASCCVGNQNDHSACCDSFHNQSNDFIDDLVSKRRLCRNSVRDLSLDYHPSKHQRLDCSDSSNISRGHSDIQRATVPGLVRDTDTGQQCQCEYLCPEGEVKEEHSCTRFPSNVDVQVSNCNLDGPGNWCQNLQRAEMRDTALTYTMKSVNECLSITTAAEATPGNITESLSSFESSTSVEISSQIPAVSITSNPVPGVLEQSYHGHLHYHCLPEKSQGDSDHFKSSLCHLSQSSDEEDVSTSATLDHRTLQQGHDLPKERTERIVLLDISTKPAELFVSYKQTSRAEENWDACNHKDALAGVFKTTCREHWDKVQPVTGVDERGMRVRSNLESETKSWAEEEKRQYVSEDHNSLDIPHKAKTAEFGAECSPPTDPGSGQGSMSFTLPDSRPSRVSGDTPSNKSSHLSAADHQPFQCYLCDRSFSQRGSLNRHVRSHLGVRPFPCPYCPMTFSRQYRVTEHMRVHQRNTLGTEFTKPSAT